jgi:hypothetical protein
MIDARTTSPLRGGARVFPAYELPPSDVLRSAGAGSRLTDHSDLSLGLAVGAAEPLPVLDAAVEPRDCAVPPQSA